MGWMIQIGHPELCHDPDGEEAPYVHIPRITHPDAPHFPGDEETNTRLPSHYGWGEFVRATGMEALFNELAPNMRGEMVRLVPRHLAQLQQIRDGWRARYPHLQPGWFDDLPNPDQRAAYHLARLEWLVWWVDWALHHGEGAAFYAAP